MRLVEGRFRLRARTEHHHERVLDTAGRDIAQGEPERVTERCEGPRAGGGVDLRHRMGDDPPIRHGIAESGRRLGVVADRAEATVAMPRHVHRMDEELMRPRESDSVGRSQVSGMAEDQLRRQQTRGECALRAVQVCQQCVEHPRSLHEPSFEDGPIVCGENQG